MRRKGRGRTAPACVATLKLVEFFAPICLHRKAILLHLWNCDTAGITNFIPATPTEVCYRVCCFPSQQLKTFKGISLRCV